MYFSLEKTVAFMNTLEDILLQGTLGLLLCPEARLDQWLGKIYTHWYIYVRPGFLVEAKPRKYSKMTTLLIYVKENIFRQKYCLFSTLTCLHVPFGKFGVNCLDFLLDFFLS